MEGGIHKVRVNKEVLPEFDSRYRLITLAVPKARFDIHECSSYL
jgi:hypothetical protein